MPALPRITLRRLMLAVALIALALWAVDTVRLSIRAARYRRAAEACARMEQKCREIVAMDPETRERKNLEAWDDPFLGDATWTARCIPFYQELRGIYVRAAQHPREPLPPLPQQP